MEDRTMLEELQAGLQEQGVCATEEEIKAAVDRLQSGELAENDLEDVAGGLAAIEPVGVKLNLFIVNTVLKNIAICSKCHTIYIKKAGHRCIKRKAGRLPFLIL